MSRWILGMFLTLDGFAEGPDGSMIRPDGSDDPQQHGSAPNAAPGSMLPYGRRAFEQNAPPWPAMAVDEKNSPAFRALARTMNALPKVVVSATIAQAARRDGARRHAPIALKLEDIKRMDTGAVRLSYLRAPRAAA